MTKAIERSSQFESLISEGNFDKLSWFTRSLLNSIIQKEEQLELLKKRYDRIVYEKNVLYGVISNVDANESR